MRFKYVIWCQLALKVRFKRGSRIWWGKASDWLRFLNMVCVLTSKLNLSETGCFIWTSTSYPIYEKSHSSQIGYSGHQMHSIVPLVGTFVHFVHAHGPWIWWIFSETTIVVLPHMISHCLHFPWQDKNGPNAKRNTSTWSQGSFQRDKRESSRIRELKQKIDMITIGDQPKWS